MKMTLMLFVVLLFFTGQVVSKEEDNQFDDDEAAKYTTSIINDHKDNLDTGDVTDKQENEMDEIADDEDELSYDEKVNLVADAFTDNNNELKVEEEKDEKTLADPKPWGCSTWGTCRRRAPVARRRSWPVDNSRRRAVTNIRRRYINVRRRVQCRRRSRCNHLGKK